MVWVEAYRVVDHGMVLLHEPLRLSYYMNDLYLLSQGARDAVQCAQLAHTVSSDD